MTAGRRCRRELRATGGLTASGLPRDIHGVKLGHFVTLRAFLANGWVGSYTESQLAVRERFSRQFNCPEGNITPELLGDGAVRATGCRRTMIFQCREEYSMEDTVRCVPEGPASPARK